MHISHEGIGVKSENTFVDSRNSLGTMAGEYQWEKLVGTNKYQGKFNIFLLLEKNKEVVKGEGRQLYVQYRAIYHMIEF